MRERNEERGERNGEEPERGENTDSLYAWLVAVELKLKCQFSRI